VRQRARDRQPLRLAAGEFLDLGVGLLGETHDLQHLVSLLGPTP
jgi:hypothetical protein